MLLNSSSQKGNKSNLFAQKSQKHHFFLSLHSIKKRLKQGEEKCVFKAMTLSFHVKNF